MNDDAFTIMETQLNFTVNEYQILEFNWFYRIILFYS